MYLQKFLTVVALLFATSANAADYKIDRQPDGPFAFTISGVKLNEESTLTRESILFNEPTCPVSVDSHTTKISYKDRGFRFLGKTGIQVKNPIVAVQVRTILYDVFGQHMMNLSNAEPKDFSIGASTLDGEWRASDQDVSELLTTVTYVARVRLLDGTQWVFNADNLQLALSTLKLEQKIGDQEKE
jgi:hypothetical protein